jgi:hypothetical protein
MPINKTQLDKVLAAYQAMLQKGRANMVTVAGVPLEVQAGESKPETPSKPGSAVATPKTGR